MDILTTEADTEEERNPVERKQILDEYTRSHQKGWELGYTTSNDHDLQCDLQRDH